MAGARRTPVEIEIKLAFESARAAHRALAKAGFTVSTPRGLEINTLYDTPAGELRARGVVLRHREYRGEHIITYKEPAELRANPATGATHKRREERETRVDDGAAIIAGWRALGLQPSFGYEKYRTVLVRPGERGHAMLDETPLGVYVELEGAASWIDRVARSMGFGPDEYIQLSYAALQAESCRKRRIAFCDLRFTKPTK